ncbi:MAG: RdgB/HAM1 family non-canonical purine NTP pyrophosphatase [Candidatus Competibacteraceae bacterium]|nr:RdgB/HAM1 family non-canonical purine NTP pyrophosphatase [Candidatus Competibacteraceae bacterium]
MPKIVLATNNPGKAREFAALLADLAVEVVPQSAFNVPEVAETGLSFVENAILKARNAALHSGLSALADDSGLMVDALGGAPGIYSARYAGPGASDRANLAQLLAELREVPKERRTARFQCVLALLRHPTDPTPLICQGSWEGVITLEPHGTHGFGYDPVFLPPDQAGKTAAELELVTKNRLSHRGQALVLLCRQLRNDPDFWVRATATAH